MKAPHRPLRVVALCTYPGLAAYTRYRIEQYRPHLAAAGVDLSLHTFLSDASFATLYQPDRRLQTAGGIVAAAGRHLARATRLPGCDVVFVGREAALVGPPVLEWVAARLLRRPMVLDLDDATYLAQPSAVHGSLAARLKGSGKTDRLIRWSDFVVCGNAVIASHVKELHRHHAVLPTIVDVTRFVPRVVGNTESPPVLGWIGTHSTFPYLEAIFPALQQLARRHPFRLRVVGAGKVGLRLAGVELEVVPWTLEGEIAAVQSFDIGLYPLPDDAWAAGKSGLKSVQYLACGVPFVASPVGAVRALGVPGETHFEARDEGEWVERLAQLLAEPELRQVMGRAGRKHAVAKFSVAATADTLAGIFRRVSGLC